jgi:hypothetical protein
LLGGALFTHLVREPVMLIEANASGERKVEGMRTNIRPYWRSLM